MAKKKRKISSRKVTLWLSRDSYPHNNNYELHAKRPLRDVDVDGDIVFWGDNIYDFCSDEFESLTRFKLKGDQLAKVTIEKVKCN